VVKNKLWRFGDSYSLTRDVFNHIELNHSAYIAEHFNLELVHLGQGGLSNLEIFNKILSNSEKYNKGDMLLINFATQQRFAIVENDKIIKINGGETDMNNQTIRNSVLSNLIIPISDIIFYLIKPFLESLIKKGVRVYHFYNDVDREGELVSTKIKNELIFNKTGFIHWVNDSGYEDLSPNGNVHYLVGKQKEIAEEIINKINEK
jgi:hypothetical protein